jgi:hypothetical protein
VTLVIGVALVIMEMNQTTRLTQAGLNGSSWGFVITRAEIYRALYATVGRAAEISMVAGFDDGRWVGPADSTFPRIFGGREAGRVAPLICRHAGAAAEFRFLGYRQHWRP